MARACCITPYVDSEGYLKKSEFKQLGAGLLLGLAGLQNLEIAAKFRQTLTHLVLFDRNEDLVGRGGFWQVFREAILESSDKEEFLVSLKSKLIQGDIIDINLLLSGRASEDRVDQGANLVIKKIREMKWFKRDEKFRFIKDLFAKEGRFVESGGVKIMKANLKDPADLECLTTICSEFSAARNSPILFHLSNALDFILERNYGGYDQGGIRKVSECSSEAKIAARSLRYYFFQPLSKIAEVNIIDSVFTHRPDEFGLGFGHHHSAVVRPQELLEYRFSDAENPGDVDPDRFREYARRISPTRDNVDRSIAPDGAVQNPSSSRLSLSSGNYLDSNL